MAESWDVATHPLWHGAAPMSWVLGVAGPGEMFVRGDGSWLIDRSGRRYLDARAGIANVMLGYSRHDVAEAMHRQALELPFVCTMRYERPAPVVVDCARALADVSPTQLTRVRFTHTGSSAVESALLMARRYHRNLGRSERVWVVGLRGGYHGSTLMTMAAGGQPMLHDAFAPMPEGFVHVAPPNEVPCGVCAGGAAASHTCVQPLVDALSEIGPERTAAVVLEPVMGFCGVPLPDHYLRSVRQLCTEHDIVLIYDEVFTGFGRTGRMFACELSGVQPDVLCLSKGMTAGYAALGAVVVSDHVYDAFDLPGQPYFAHGSSTDAHPIACAAALAVLEAYEREDVVARGRRVGERLVSTLARDLSACATVRRVWGIGPFVFIALATADGRPASMDVMRYVQAECELRGVLVDYTPQVVMVVPPLTLSDRDANVACDAVASVLAELREDDVEGAALRPPSVSGRR